MKLDLHFCPFCRSELTNHLSFSDGRFLSCPRSIHLARYTCTEYFIQMNKDGFIYSFTFLHDAKELITILFEDEKYVIQTFQKYNYPVNIDLQISSLEEITKACQEYLLFK